MRMARKIEERFCILLFRNVGRRWLIATVLTVVIASLLLYLSELAVNDQASKFLGLPARTWNAFAISMLAAAVFSALNVIVEKLGETERQVKKDALDEFSSQGLLSVLPLRGDRDASQLYSRKLELAKKTVWVIGMTNGKVISDHFPIILRSLMKYKTMDVVISFWSPDAILHDDKLRSQTRNLVDIQEMLEQGCVASTHLNGVIAERQGKIKQEIQRKSDSVRGRIRILNMAIPTNITCFIIDDEVFFFPFLSKKTSTSMPTLLFSAKKGVGRAVFEHISYLINDPEMSPHVCSTVYEFKGQRR